MLENKDYFVIYMEKFPDVPSLVLVRSVELKNFPREYIKQPVLDLCCGDGFFSKCLGLTEIYGCDIDKSVVMKAEETKVYKDLKVCDVRDLYVYPDAYFRTIISNCALEHVDGINNALSEISRVLQKDGTLVMTVPSDLLMDAFPPKKFFHSIGLKKFGQRLLDKYNEKQAHRNILSLNQWTEQLNKAGLKVVYHCYLFDESSYKTVLMWDWLLSLHFFSIIHKIFRLLLPPRARESFWRKKLKKLYLKSSPLEKGGELLITAKK
jgi:ubiquinone/menaquinone biosynthesis C-methylase UbiE